MHIITIIIHSNCDNFLVTIYLKYCDKNKLKRQKTYSHPRLTHFQTYTCRVLKTQTPIHVLLHLVKFVSYRRKKGNLTSDIKKYKNLYHFPHEFEKLTISS